MQPTPHFYPFPRAWLAGVTDAGDFDTRDLLLSKAVAGQVIFAHPKEEAIWSSDQKKLRRFFTRQTYARHRDGLLKQGLLRYFTPPPCPAGVAATTHRALYRPIKYVVADGAPAALPPVYRVHAYLRNRWPVWLGNSDLGSRAILTVLLAGTWQATPTARATSLPMTSVTIAWTTICTEAQRLFVADAEPATKQRFVHHLHKGRQELLILDAVQAVETGALAYTFLPAALEQAPTWSLAAMATACQADPVMDGLPLTLVRRLMRVCWEPVTRLQAVWNLVQHQRGEANLGTADDWHALHKFVQNQPTRVKPRHAAHLLADYLRDKQAQPILLGEPFVLTAAARALAHETPHGQPIRLPHPHRHGVDATQLCISCRRTDGLTVAEAQAILATVEFVVIQAVADRPPVVALLPCPRPKSLSIDYGFVVRANQLHRAFDFGLPLEVLLRCAAPDPRLTLHCTFRILLQTRQ